jgi:hypothetical protein
MGFDFGEGKEDETKVKDPPMTKEEIFNLVLTKLDSRIESKKYDSFHDKKKGLRSRQSASTIDALVEMGIITEDLAKAL